MSDIVILSGARTAIGTFGGSLASVTPIELGTIAASAALERAGIEGDKIGHTVFGHVINTEPRASSKPSRLTSLFDTSAPFFSAAC